MVKMVGQTTKLRWDDHKDKYDKSTGHDVPGAFCCINIKVSNRCQEPEIQKKVKSPVA